MLGVGTRSKAVSEWPATVLIHAWPKLVIEWENSDIGWGWIWYRIAIDE